MYQGWGWEFGLECHHILGRQWKGSVLVWWDELGSAGVAVLLRSNELLSSIAFIIGGSGSGFTTWLSCITSDSVEILGLEGWTV